MRLSEIGVKLSISENTVKTHARAIYWKLGASCRRDAVDQAYQLGILSQEKFMAEVNPEDEEFAKALRPWLLMHHFWYNAQIAQAAEKWLKEKGL